MLDVRGSGESSSRYAGQTNVKHVDFSSFFPFVFQQPGLPSPLQGKRLHHVSPILENGGECLHFFFFLGFRLWLPCKASQALWSLCRLHPSPSWLRSPAHLLWARCPVIVHQRLCAERPPQRHSWRDNIPNVHTGSLPVPLHPARQKLRFPGKPFAFAKQKPCSPTPLAGLALLPSLRSAPSHTHRCLENMWFEMGRSNCELCNLG